MEHGGCWGLTLAAVVGLWARVPTVPVVPIPPALDDTTVTEEVWIPKTAPKPGYIPPLVVAIAADRGDTSKPVEIPTPTPRPPPEPPEPEDTTPAAVPAPKPEPIARVIQRPRDVCAASGGRKETFSQHGHQYWRCRY